jgi:hypothetical protein
MLEKLGLLPQCLRVALSARCESPTRSVWRIRRPFFSLLIVEGVREVYPQATIVTECAPYLVEDIEEVPDEIVGMCFMAQLALPAVGPLGGRSVASQQVKRW